MNLREEFNPPMPNYLCEDIVIQILRYLPVKALLRFRCVCKWMNRTIDSDSFMLDHLSLQKPQFILQTTLRSVFFLPIHHQSFSIEPRWRDFVGLDKTFVLGTLHGVVCLYDNDIGLVLWNPSTRQHSIPRPLKYEMVCNSDLYIWHYYYCGFWIDPDTKDFKVIIGEIYDDFSGLTSLLYNSIEDEWIEGPEISEMLPHWDSDTGEEGVNVRPAVMIGGSVNWIALEERHDMDDEDFDIVMVILSFDFEQERFNVIDMPEERGYDSVLFKWQGNLSVVCRNRKFPKTCNVFSWQQDSWAKLYNIDLVNPVKKVFWVMGETEGRRRALASTDYNLVLYVCKAAISPLRVENWGSEDFFLAYDFVESLLFPDR